MVLETISEVQPLKAALPPRPRMGLKQEVFEGARIKTDANYGDDQDPSHSDDEEYARHYTAMQSRKAASQAKKEESPKFGSPGSDTSEQCKAFVCNMSAGQEPLYGDPGEEDTYDYLS